MPFVRIHRGRISCSVQNFILPFINRQIWVCRAFTLLSMSKYTASTWMPCSNGSWMVCGTMDTCHPRWSPSLPRHSSCLCTAIYSGGRQQHMNNSSSKATLRVKRWAHRDSNRRRFLKVTWHLVSCNAVPNIQNITEVSLTISRSHMLSGRTSPTRLRA